jgi:hypothetical protein
LRPDMALNQDSFLLSTELCVPAFDRHIDMLGERKEPSIGSISKQALNNHHHHSPCCSGRLAGLGTRPPPPPGQPSAEG